MPLLIMGPVNDMNDSIKPNWVKRRASKTIVIEAKREARTEREKAALKKFESEGPEFWRQLLLELRVNADALGEIGASGKVDSHYDEGTNEEICRVDVVKKGPIIGMTYVAIYYKPGDTKIRSHTKEGEATIYTFCVLPGRDGLRVVSSDGVEPLTARGMAEKIVEELFERASEAV